MKKQSIYIFLLFFIGLGFILSQMSAKNQQKLSGHTQANPEIAGEISLIRIGYCPTMQRYLSQFENERFSFSLYPNSAFALQALWVQEVDAVLIGRRAAQDELPGGILERQLQEGYTLVGLVYQEVPYSSLRAMTVYTDVDVKIARELLPEETEVQFVQSFDTGIIQNFSSLEVALISWEDYEGSLQLIVPMDGDKKVINFRTPFLYFYSEIEHELPLEFIN